MKAIVLFALVIVQIITDNVADGKFVASTARNTTTHTKEQNNTNDLVQKIDALLAETKEITQKIDDLTKRQEELEGNMAKIVEQQMSSMNVTLKEKDNLEILRNWTTIARRMDGSVNFYRGWNEYKFGFGNPPHGEFFIGLKRLHELTTAVPNIELKVILRDWKGEERYAHYDGFRVGNETEKYKLKALGKYSGTAGDSLSSHKGVKFSTFDEDNDKNGADCAKSRSGAWWFYNCSYSHLFGPYRKGKNINSVGIDWYHWKYTHDYSFKYAEMLIRAKRA
ncbi:ficolin-1-like [Musca vetustissima]|uniref:ficolin-1-like n=1 Tax=Musca vetustissima TaxID=27455 RepID=UPI002AB6AA38|nr:ficolin-1-like [Musca vetustissima]